MCWLVHYSTALYRISGIKFTGERKLSSRALMVVIICPAADQYLIVHGCLLIEKSSFCRKELTKNITKGGTKEQTLPAGSVSVLA